jgi:ADP-ribosylation factor-binding protein GGA
MQWKILEFIQNWNHSICLHSRYKHDLRHINDMHRLLSFKGYAFPNFDPSSVVEEEGLKSEQQLHDEDRQAQEAVS